MGIDIVMTNDGCYTFAGNMKDVGRQKFNMFSNPKDSPYAHFLKTKSPRLTAKLLEEYPDTMGCLVFNQKGLLHKFVEDFQRQEDAKHSSELNSLGEKISVAASKRRPKI